MNFTDPTAPLLDFIVRDGRAMWRSEQPRLTCPCDGTAWIENSWLLQRDAVCTCSPRFRGYTEILHEDSCDAVPCPFCPLENP